MKKKKKVFNVGYQGRSVDDLCATLRAAGVEVLVDVRAIAWSQRPQYRKTALSEALRASGIEYVHCKVAGNPYRKADDWQACRDLYTQHLLEHPDVLTAVEEAVSTRVAALFCYEAERDSCHRGVIIELFERDRPGFSFIDL